MGHYLQGMWIISSHVKLSEYPLLFSMDSDLHCVHDTPKSSTNWLQGVQMKFYEFDYYSLSSRYKKTEHRH